MIVFVWKCYGTIQVLKADTRLEKVKVLNEVLDYIEAVDWGEDKFKIEELKSEALKPDSDIEWVVRELLYHVGNGWEAFEHGTDFYTVE